MNYLDKKKDWKYFLKSSAFTFASVFLPIFGTLVASYDLSGIKPEQVDSTLIVSGIVTFLRLVLVAGTIAGQKLISKYAK